jgi:hypothetical protein
MSKYYGFGERLGMAKILRFLGTARDGKILRFWGTAKDGKSITVLGNG